MLFLDGVYIDGQKGGAARFRQVKAPGTAQLTHTIAHRIGRYLERQDISWPAQALSYKLGEYTIWQLRNEAESRLGADFDLRDFHDFILALGSVPLEVLKDEVSRWVSEQIPTE
jgi:uncharacterized protein (DUF885 family)